MKARKTDQWALGILIAALVLFLLSLILVNERWYEPANPFLAGIPGADGEWREVRGYQWWVLVYGLMEAGLLDDFHRGMAGAALLGAVVVMVAPFLVGVLNRARPLWWLVVFCSASSLAGAMAGFVFSRKQESWDAFDYELGIGYYLGVASHVINFIGLLCIREFSEKSDLESRPVGTE